MIDGLLTCVSLLEALLIVRKVRLALLSYKVHYSTKSLIIGVYN